MKHSPVKTETHKWQVSNPPDIPWKPITSVEELSTGADGDSGIINLMTGECIYCKPERIQHLCSVMNSIDNISYVE